MSNKKFLKTKTGLYKTDKQSIRKFNDEFSVKLLRYKEINKLNSTYLIPIIARLQSDSRLHGQYNQSVVITGRLSSSNPNLQNISTRTTEGHKIKDCFIPKEGTRLIIADYSQIELRVLAHFSQDRNLLDAFNNDVDVHEVTAKLIFDTQNPTKEQRFIGKTVNFARVYGASANKLCMTINNLGNVDKFYTVEQSQAIINKHKQVFSGVELWKERTLKECRSKLDIKTVLGRPIPIENINSIIDRDRWEAERCAVNYVIQGSSADIIKKCMLGLSNYNILASVHDELVFESNIPDMDIIEIKTQMENCVQLNNVRLKVEAKICDTWGEK